MNDRALDRELAPILAAEPPDPDGDGQHLDPEQAGAWLAGEMAPEHLEAVARHLEACADCAERVLDLESLRAEPPADPDVADLEIEAAWRSFTGHRETARSGRPAGRDPLPAPGPSPSLWPRSGGWWLAAAFAMLAMGLGWQVARLQLSQAAPEVNVPVAYLETVRSGSAGRLVLAPENRTVLLILSPAEPGDSGSYRVEIEAANGSWRRQVEGLTLSDHNSIRFTMAAGDLVPGDYRVELWGDAPEPVATFLLQVAGPEAEPRR